MSSEFPSAPAAAASGPSLSLLQRSIAVFARPSQAWDGLRERTQWWFPLVVLLLVHALSAAVLFRTAMIPMLHDQWEEQIAAGNMTTEQMDKASAFMDSNFGLVATIVPQVVMLVLLTLLEGLLLWFGAGFVLGTGMKFRWALEVVSWSGLVTIPGAILMSVLAWTNGTMKNLHIGFGILLPSNDPPTRILTALGAFLDGIGPLAIWFLIVAILGASALSGAPVRRIAGVLVGIYLAVLLFGAGLAAVMVPAS